MKTSKGLGRLGVALIMSILLIGAGNIRAKSTEERKRAKPTPASVRTKSNNPFDPFFRTLKHVFSPPQRKPMPRHRQKQGAEVQNSPLPSPTPTPAAAAADPNAAPNERNTRSATLASSRRGEDLRYGTPVPGKQGFVTSPFSPNSGYIDVRGFAPGTPVRDPYSGKVFLTP